MTIADMTDDEINAEWSRLIEADLGLSDRALELEGEMRARCGVLGAASDVLAAEAALEDFDRSGGVTLDQVKANIEPRN